MRGSRKSFTVAVAIALALVTPRAALAQIPTPQPATTNALKVWLDAPPTLLDKQRLRESLARELKRDVVLTSDAGSAAVQIRLRDEAHAQVEYTTASGERLTREVELPPDKQRSLEVLSWLTVNLVRDEASELLDELRARRKEEADARAAEEQAAAERAAQDKAAADKAAADKAAADKAKPKIALQVEPAPSTGLLQDPKRSYDLALVTPFSLLPDSAKRELWLQLALAYGESGGMRGVG